ncbi:MAG: imidazole glycerol phosphate synthase cyclase subunit [Firmicutes bacterium]|nr:imidazole glycerol phosphate synthase cyclase subunit [Bacillota bacterium]
MLTARLIPCLDVKHGRTVKGVTFDHLTDQGDPIALALAYAADGADEIVWLDITATLDDVRPRHEQIARLRSQLRIPLTVGGGIRGVADVEGLIDHGADKVSINSAALADPRLIEQVAIRWGSQATIVAVDAQWQAGEYRVFSHGGRRDAGRELGDWLREAEARGAGEFLITSIDQDGRQQGYDVTMLRYARTLVKRPIIASGGAGHVNHLARLLDEGGQYGLLLASLLHGGQTSVGELKRQLHARGYRVRVPN